MANTTDLDLNAICNQRRQNLLYTLPPTRFEPQSPYVQYPNLTKFDFDMRRKAEILEYSASKSNTKTNNLTKKQKMSQIMSGKMQNKSFSDIILFQPDTSDNYNPIVVKYPDTYTISYQENGIDMNGDAILLPVYNIVKGNIADCLDIIQPKSSSASGVPGPAIYLYKDDKIPLYNYNITRNYSILNSDNTAMWRSITANDTVFIDTINNKLLSLAIQNNINEYAYTFTIETPISLYFIGTVSKDIPNGHISLINNITDIANISVIVNYNEKIVGLKKVPIITNVGNFANVTYDISFNKTSNNDYFSGQIYLGMLSISNLYLFTQPGYIYDIQLNFTVTSQLPALYDSYFDTFTSGVICNVSDINTTVHNCLIKSPTYSPTSLLYKPFGITGT